jgi:hypothetical protein
MLLLCVMAGLSTTTKRAGLTCNSLGNLHRPFEFQLKNIPDSEHGERSGRITRDFFSLSTLFLRTEIAILRLYFILLNFFFIRRQSSYDSKVKRIAFACLDYEENQFHNIPNWHEGGHFYSHVLFSLKLVSCISMKTVSNIFGGEN